MGQKQTSLGTTSVGKLLFQLSMPAIAAQIINVLYNMVDRMYIGHIPDIGPQALTGVGVTLPVIMCISAFACLASMGGAPRSSIMMGRKNDKMAEQILGNCTCVLIILAVILTIVFQVFGRQILMIFGASDNTIEYAWSYMQIYSMGTIFVQVSLGLNAFITSQGFAKMSMITVLIGAVSNIILDPIFIFGFKMGVSGAALATVISQAISSVAVLCFLTSKKSHLRIRKKYLWLKPSVIFPCLALGLSPFIMQFTESVITVCFNVSLLKYGGDLAVGAMTILVSVMQFSMLPVQGLTQGSQPIISYNFGAGKLDRVSKTFKILLISCLSFTTIIWAICMFAPTVFISIFTSDPELMEYTKGAIRIYMAVSLVFGAQIACQQTFIALGNAVASLFLALLRKVILLIPLIFIIPQFMDNKVNGVFLAEPMADICAVSVTVILFTVTFKKMLKKWKNSQTIEDVDLLHDGAIMKNDDLGESDDYKALHSDSEEVMDKVDVIKSDKNTSIINDVTLSD